MNEHSMLMGLSNHRSDEDDLREALSKLPISELQKLAFDVDPMSRPSLVDGLKEKMAEAARHGRALAHENSNLDKIAFLPALAAGAARAVGALGGAKGIVGGIAKDMAIGGAANKIMGALKPAAPAAAAAGEVAGGFKYAGIAGAGGMLQRAAGYVARNPGTALTAAGALGGAMMAPRDPQTGQKQYLRGALMGGGVAAGVNALSNGSIANKMRASVMNRDSPVFGQGARKYMMDAAASTKGKVPGANGGYTRAASTPAASAAPAPAPSPAPYTGGPTMGAIKLSFAGIDDLAGGALGYSMGRRQAERGESHNFGARQFGSLLLPGGFGYQIGRAFGHHGAQSKEKKANQRLLTYDPATKTFARTGAAPTGPTAFAPKAR